MNATPWKLRVLLPRKRRPIFVGPVFAGSADMVQRRAAALLRRTVLRPLDTENPLICDRMLKTTVAVPEHCTLYDLSCFASPREHDYFSCSRFTRDLSSLRAFISSSRGARTLQELRTRYGLRRRKA